MASQEISPHKKSSGASTPLTVTRKVTKVTLGHTKPILGLAVVHISAIAGGATTLTWYLAEDATGDVAITPEVTDTILLTPTSLLGTVSRTVDVGLDLAEGSEDVYFVMKLDVGTATGVPRVNWKR